MKRLMVIALLGACSTQVETGPDAGIAADINTGNIAVGHPGDVTIARAMEWVDVQLQYCQAPNHQRDYDAACAMTCNRQDNVDWDPYRSDCSGFVSWAWGLPSPGRVTSQFAPFKTDLTHSIVATDLRTADAVNNTDHMMLFEKWVDKPTKATFLEEPGCSSSTPYAHEFTATVMAMGNTIVVVNHGTFTAIRYDDAP
jgi:hypothetical protein